MGLKTLHLTNAWHETSGGIATFYRALIDAANRTGHQIRLVVPGETTRLEAVGECAKIYYVKAPRARFNAAYRMIYPSQYLRAGSPLQIILATERPELVEICDKYALNYLGAVLRGGMLRGLNFRPVVVGLSCERMDDAFRTYIGRLPLAGAFCAAYLKWVYFPFFDHHIANSEYTAEELRDASRGHEVRRKIWIRPMGVDLRHFSPNRRSPEGRRQLRKNANAGEDSVVLVYAGRLVPEKHLSLLFEPFVRLVRSGKRDYRLVVAGDGIERRRWEQLSASRVPGRVTFLGHVKNLDDLANLLANCDAFVHPNPSEPFGIAPLEAMASGLPLVAPNRGGVATYANAENAWIAAPQPESFVSAIEALFDQPAEAARRARNALQMAAEFSWEKTAASFLDLYADLHHAAATRSEAIAEPAFCSNPATGLQLVLSRAVSRSAENIFRLTSRVVSHPRIEADSQVGPAK